MHALIGQFADPDPSRIVTPAHDVLTGGESAQVNYHMDPAPTDQTGGTPPAGCSITDAGNGQTSSAAKGSTFTDSRGQTYGVGNECGLTEINTAPAGCSYNDAGNGQPITAAKGSTFTDSRGQTYRVGDDCGIVPT
ncbi:MAG: hypothetical protein QOG10_6568 [Kribbellaceae bacterium]|nr:Phospholipase [Pseudonocardia sp.]MDX6241744.1 hypothetical protein [Kribbellaceae bacterium]